MGCFGKSASELGGGAQNRTGVQGFAGPCLNHSATPPGQADVTRSAADLETNGHSRERPNPTALTAVAEH